MPTRLLESAADFAGRFQTFLQARAAADGAVQETVAAIIADVRTRGDAALLGYTERFDRVKLTAQTLRLSSDATLQAAQRCDAKVRDALAIAADRIREYHVRQLPENADFTDAEGVRLGWRWTPLASCGMYVPGGQAAYPSSVLMNAVPAKVAGVKRLVMVVPTPNGELNPAIFAAALIAKVDEIYCVGGAQAVAALTYGTESIAAVDKIVGPGNAYVAEAKRQVFGTVGIDMVAGPSEVLVVADNKNDPRWIAADLLSQAEHDADAQSILITDDEAFAGRVEAEIQALLRTLRRANIAGASWERHGGIIVVASLDKAAALVDRLAPEHVQLAVDEPGRLATKIQHAGALFLGRHTPEAIGDYMAGPSHVLPTSRTARFSSGLSVLDFMKRSSVIACTPEALQRIGGDAAILADAEGLGAHALSLRLRLE